VALAAAIGGGARATTNGADCLAALAASGVSRPFVVLPPWFGEGMIPQAEAYLRAAGVEPTGVFRHVPAPKWRDVPPNRLYAEGMHLEQEPDRLLDQIVALYPAEADGVLIFGTGFRSVAVIAAAEAALGRPVVTANQASLWRCLRLAGLDGGPEGYGALFTRPLPG